MRAIVENRRERLALVEDAGMSRISATSILAGVLVGYGAFALLAGLTAAVLGAVDVDVNLQGDDVGQAGTVSAVVLGLVLFLSYLFASYTAGRMARRAGMTHGLVVFATSLVLAAVAAVVVEVSNATDDVVDGLRNLGVPTSADQWRDIGTLAGIASLAGMLLGCIVGGAMGERWHTKLVTRALDPGVGPEAVVRAAQAKALRAEERRHEINLSEEQQAEDAPAAEPATGDAATDRESATANGGATDGGSAAGNGGRRRSRGKAKSTRSAARGNNRAG